MTAIVSADVVGYSRLMGLDESGTLVALKSHVRELIDPKIAEYGGRTVKSMGDGLLLEFPSVVDAVRCAVDVQRGMAERNAGVPTEQQIQFRLGINVGDIIIDGDDIFGDGVNVAARLQTLAEPGGICVSRGVRDQVLDKLSFTFKDLGAQNVKNIARPVEAYRVEVEGELLARRKSTVPRSRTLLPLKAVMGAAVIAVVALVSTLLWRTSHRDVLPAPPAMSVGVLPLVAPAGDVAMGQRADTLTRDIISTLTKNATITRVVPGPSVQATAEGSKGLRAVASALNVRFLLEGQIRPEVSATVVTLRLMNAVTGEQVASETVPLKLDGATTEPMQAAVFRLRSVMGDSEMRRVMAQPRGDATAIDLVLLAGALDLTDPDTLHRAKEKQKLYEEALRRDANLVPALVGFSWALELELYDDMHADRARLLARMDELTIRAVNLNRGVPSIWGRRARVLLLLGQADAALEASATGMRLDPGNADTIMLRAWLMNMLGRPGEALKLGEQAVALSQGNDDGPVLEVCLAHLLLGHYKQASSACENAKVLSFNDRWAHINLTAAYAQLGDMVKASVVRDELRRLAPDLTIAGLKNSDSMIPEYVLLAEQHFYAGLRKAGISEK